MIDWECLILSAQDINALNRYYSVSKIRRNRVMEPLVIALVWLKLYIGDNDHWISFSKSYHPVKLLNYSTNDSSHAEE